MKTRRDFVAGLAAASAAGVAWPPAGARAQGVATPVAPAETPTAARDRWGELLPTRAFGRSEERVTLMGLGGQHFRFLPEGDRQACIEIAMEGGVRFFDTATNYGRDQLSEREYGRCLTPRYRDEVFVMTKSAARDAAGAQRDLEQSLRNMGTDVLDLWQVHTIESAADVDRRFDNGVIDVFLRAKEEGKARHIGFTGHKTILAHQRMLARLAELGVEMDACQMPVNIADPAYDSFITEVMPTLLERGYAVLAMKTMCGGKLFGDAGEFGPRAGASVETVIPDRVPFVDATSYVWSLPIATRITGVDTLDQLRENIAAAQAIRSLTAEQANAVLAAAADAAGPEMEYYKRNTRPGADENF